MGNLNIQSTTIEKSLELATNFLDKLTGSSVKEMGLLFNDNVKLWRLKNQIRNLEKVKKLVSKKGLELKHVNLKVLLPYLEGVSLETDDFLQDKWANLLTNYIDSSKNLKIAVYPGILKQLSTNEVKILEYTKNYNLFYGNHFNAKNNKDNFKGSNEEIANLERLGLIKEVVEISKYGDGHSDYEELVSDEYYITPFGKELIRACMN